MPFEIDPRLIVLFVCVAVAGVARGLAGFGTGMIIVPPAAALYGPQAAIVIVVVVDTLPAVPLTLPVLRLARWREVLPVFAGLFLLVPAGVLILKASDPVALRWAISLLILALVVLLLSGWRYRGPRTPATSFAAGGLAGLLQGTASLPGPPLIVYWLGATIPAALMRANLMTLLLLGEFVSLVNLWLAGVMTREAVATGVLAAPVYFAGLLAGWLAFSRANEAVYRRVAFGLIVLAAVLALPPLDRAFSALASAVTG